VAAFIVVIAFLICLGRKITCRIVTTSVAEHHLKVLWGEISRFITTSRRSLVYESLKNPAGILVVNYQEVRRTEEREAKNPLNYLVGRVSQKDEGLAGHHAEFTMFVGDEASGLDDAAYEAAQGLRPHGTGRPGSSRPACPVDRACTLRAAAGQALPASVHRQECASCLHSSNTRPTQLPTSTHCLLQSTHWLISLFVTLLSPNASEGISILNDLRGVTGTCM
jgi:hypothetical protein